MKVNNDVHDRKQILVEMTAGFCDKKLDSEYRELCEKLINKMAGKRQVPFLTGKLELWAAAVVHALGYINFLFDKNTVPYVSRDDICGYFKTSKSSTVQKSKLIRDMFKMSFFDPEFSTSQAAQSNPLADMGIINGLFVPLDMLKSLGGAAVAEKKERHLRLVENKTADSEKNQKETLYIIKVTLRGFRPPIWRRFQIAGSSTLYKLHRVLQVVMGWENSHLYQFCIENVFYGDPDPGYGIENAKKTRLDQVAGARDSFTYEYDFGDGWNHSIRVEKVLPAQEKAAPRCLAGKRACPPEDCGGSWGYEEILEAINDPEHGEDEMLEWVEEDYDPEAFDLDQVNKELRRLKC